MKKLLALIPVLALFAGITCAQAADLKVGTIDLPTILQKSPQIAVINNQLKSQFAPQQQKIMQAQSNLQAEATKLSSTTTKLTAAEQQQLKTQIINDQKALQQMVTTYQQNVSAAQTKALNSFMGEVDSAVKTIAQKQSLDIVLLKPAVIYSPTTTDITDQVIAALPKQ